MEETMQALVLAGPNRFAVQEVPIPEPALNEVRCRVRSVAVCGTDIHIIQGDFPGFWPPSFPLIPGHEWAGDVVELGPGAERLGWNVGDRVAGTSHAACGYCPQCVNGRYNLCENYGRAGLHAQYGHNAPGSYATYTVHSVRSVFRIPDALEYDDAAILDPASIALHTARRGGIQAGDVVAVTGAGVIGLLAGQAARVLGADRVVVVGRGQRLVFAQKLGFDVVDATQDDPVEAVRRLTGGLGVEVALECAGEPEPFQWCVRMLRRGGRCAVVGIPTEPGSISLQSLVLDELDVVGVRASAGEMARVIPLVASGRINVHDLITHRFPLAEFDEAFRVLKQRLDGVLKVVVHPEQL
jgi:L-iditol 2-dehydrogenase